METVPSNTHVVSFHFSGRALGPSVVPENQSPSLFRVQGLLELFSLAHPTCWRYENVRWLTVKNMKSPRFTHCFPTHSQWIAIELQCLEFHSCAHQQHECNGVAMGRMALIVYDSSTGSGKHILQQKELKIWHQVCPTVIKGGHLSIWRKFNCPIWKEYGTSSLWIDKFRSIPVFP